MVASSLQNRIHANGGRWYRFGRQRNPGCDRALPDAERKWLEHDWSWQVAGQNLVICFGRSGAWDHSLPEMRGCSKSAPRSGWGHSHCPGLSCLSGVHYCIGGVCYMDLLSKLFAVKTIATQPHPQWGPSPASSFHLVGNLCHSTTWSVNRRPFATSA